MKKIVGSIFSRENLAALILCMIVIALVIITADLTSSSFLYEGF